MKLQTVQHIDISNAVTSVISVDELTAHASFNQDEEEVGGISYVTVKSTPRYPAIQTPSGETIAGTLAFKARPLFPGSLLSTEICVYLSDRHGTMLPDKAFTDQWRLDTGSLDSPIETNLYYRLHAPLPAYLANYPYQSESSLNCLALVSSRTSLRNVDAIIARSLNSRLLNVKKSRSGKKIVPIRMYIETEATAALDQDSVSTSFHQFKAEQLEHACHRLNIIGKAGLVMCDTAGIAVDAIRGSVPAAFITPVPDGFEKVQACALDFLQHGDRDRLLTDQQKALRDIQDSFSGECHVLSNQGTLRALLSTCITTLHELHPHSLEHHFSSHVVTTKAAPDIDFDGNQCLILRTQQTFCSATSKSVRFKSGLASSRRKFQKFKESPSRFMEDSQIRILRSLVNPRTQ